MLKINKLFNHIILEEFKIPDVLYHATYKPLLNNIKKSGLGNTKITMWNDSIPGVVYLADDPDIAESYAEEAEIISNEEWLDQIVILQINKSNLDINKLFIDKNIKLDSDESPHTFEYHGIVPFENIKIFRG